MGSHDYAEEECFTCEAETTGSGIFAGDAYIYICNECQQETEHYRPREE